MLKVSSDPSPLDFEVKVPVAPSYLPVPPTIAPETLSPTSPPTLRANCPSGTSAVPEHVPLSLWPGLVAMQTAVTSATVFFEESCSGTDKANPLPGGLLLSVAFPIGAKCDPLSNSVKLRVSSLPVVSSVQP